MYHDALLVFLGVGALIGIQVAFGLVRRLLGLSSARDRAEAARADAETARVAAEDRLRLAELEIARNGAPPPAPEHPRVTIRPLR
jgi:hypothetical protein